MWTVRKDLARRNQPRFPHLCDRRLALAAGSVVGMLGGVAHAQQYSVSNLNTPLVETFDSYGGTASPTNWNVTITGNNFRGQGTGSSNTGGVWSYGATGSTERALGYLPSSTSSAFTGVANYVNNSTSTINALTIAYNFEQWRFTGAASSNRTNGFVVSYSIDGGAYQSLSDLGFAVNGGASASSGSPTETPLTTTISSLSIDPGHTFSIKFVGDRGTGGGSSQGVAIDDLSVTAGGSAASGNDSTISSDTNTISLGRAIVGASISTQPANLSKSGTAATTYNISTSGAATASPSGDQNFGGGSQSQQVQIGINDTSSVGTKTGTVTVHNTAADSAGAGQGSADSDDTINVSASIVDHAQPTIGPADHPHSLTVDFGVRALNSTTPTISGAVSNPQSAAGETAGLNVSSVSVSGDSTKASIDLAPFTNLSENGSHSFLASLNTSSIGQFSSQYTVGTSDENIPGATGLSDLTVTVTGRVALGGDANLDNSVNALDFNTLASNFGNSNPNWTDGDFNRDGAIDASDFEMLSLDFGQSVSPSLSLGTAVPEPAGIAIAALAISSLARRARRSH
jgi:hypothetical protein